MKTGIELIAQERQEQITKHHRTIEEDVQYNKDEQIREAMFILMADNIEELGDHLCPKDWDPRVFKKMLNKPIKERLAIIGAFAAAELDRLNYIETHKIK